ncbi:MULTISPECIES: TetR/AcrR family transcriptional regulator [Sutterella]|nr:MULTISPECIES: TetR family transcriptional regulator [Sutterella]
MPAASPADHADNAPERAARRYDPERRRRIIASALEVIARHGVEGASIRLVAKEADVPLGSMTYHFRGREELLYEAMQSFIDELSALTFPRLETAKTREEALEVLSDYLCWPVDKRLLLLTYELYAYAARNEAVKPLVAEFQEKVRLELMRFFPKHVASILNALVDGACIHRAYDEDPPAREEYLEVIRRLAGLSPH